MIGAGVHADAVGATRGRAPRSRARRSTCCSAQVENGAQCPVTMTYAVVPALRAQPPTLARATGCRASCRTTTTRARCPVGEKRGALLGMGMTEKQGGSDVRANTTRARTPTVAATGASLPHHRPQVVLLGADVRRPPGARADRRGAAGLSCFFLPRFRARRHAQRDPHPAPEGQARQPLERVERGRVRRRRGLAGRRGRPRHADHPRDGQPHAARLRDRHAPASCAPRCRAGAAPRARIAAPSASRSPSSR